jgi:N-acetyl-beta-hexosaminidase
MEANNLSIIPLPLEMERKEDKFVLTPETIIVADAPNQWNATFLRELLAPPTGFALPVLLSKAYKFEPVFSELDAQATRHVLGLEAPLWTEFVRNQARLDYQTYPRLTAFAETGWTRNEKKDFKNFWERLSGLLRRFDELGIKYAPASDVEPSRLKQLFGIWTIAQPQTKTAPQYL